MSGKAAVSINLILLCKNCFAEQLTEEPLIGFYTPCRVFTELSEVSRPGNPQGNYFAEICVTAVQKGYKRVRKNVSQTNLRSNPLNTGMASSDCILYVSNTYSTKAVSKYHTSFSAVFYQNAN